MCYDACSTCVDVYVLCSTCRPGPPLKSFKQWLEAPKIGKALHLYKPTFGQWSLKYTINFFFFQPTSSSCTAGFNYTRFFFSLFIPHVTLNSLTPSQRLFLFFLQFLYFSLSSGPMNFWLLLSLSLSRYCSLWLSLYVFLSLPLFIRIPLSFSL